MTPVFFTPGPAQLFPTVPAHLEAALRAQVPSISHRSPAYCRIHQHTTEAVRALLGAPPEVAVFFLASATEAWERLAQNLGRDGSLHFVNGAFSAKNYAIAAANLGPLAQAITVPWHHGFEAGHYAHAAPLVHFTHNETSTGAMMPQGHLHAYAQAHPEALLAVDIVSSAPYPVLDWGRVDIAYFSVQKGMGLPAGLGVLMAGPRALARAEAHAAVQDSYAGSYHSFAELHAMARKHQTPETPNVLGIYLLGQVAEDMCRIGPEALRDLLAQRAEALYAALDRLPGCAPAVRDPDWRSHTVVVAQLAGGTAPLLARLEAQGLVLGSGYGPEQATHLRVANFAAVPEVAFARLLAALPG